MCAICVKYAYRRRDTIQRTYENININFRPKSDACLVQYERCELTDSNSNCAECPNMKLSMLLQPSDWNVIRQSVPEAKNNGRQRNQGFYCVTAVEYQ